MSCERTPRSPRAQYRDPVLGLIFLAFAEHRFEQLRPELESKATERRPVSADDFRARGVLYVPEIARLSWLVDLPEAEDYRPIGSTMSASHAPLRALDIDRRRIQPRLRMRVHPLVGGLCAAAVIAASAPAGASPADSAPAAVTTAFQTVALAHYTVTSTTCFTYPPSSGRLGGGCAIGDGAVRRPIRLHERVKALFGGTVTLLLPEQVDTVYVGFGRRPGTEYHASTVVSPLPGSGTYDMVVTVKWHDEFAHGETTHLVPLWVPRR